MQWDDIGYAPAGSDDAFQTHRREEGAEEELGVGMAAAFGEHGPLGRLLRGLLQRVVLEQVRKPHLRVADVVAERHVGGDVDAVRLQVSAAPA